MPSFAKLPVRFRVEDALLLVDHGRQSGVAWVGSKAGEGSNQRSLCANLECRILATQARAAASVIHRKVINEIASRCGERDFAVRPPTHGISVGVGLTIILPPADEADFVSGCLVECRKAAARAGVPGLTETEVEHEVCDVRASGGPGKVFGAMRRMA